MNHVFNARHGLIGIQAELFGLSGRAVLRLALDTGATATLVNVGLLVALGYDPALAPNRVQVTTGSGVEFAPRVTVSKLMALGQAQTDFPVLGHTCHRAPGSMVCWA